MFLEDIEDDHFWRSLKTWKMIFLRTLKMFLEDLEYDLFWRSLKTFLGDLEDDLFWGL